MKRLLLIAVLGIFAAAAGVLLNTFIMGNSKTVNIAEKNPLQRGTALTGQEKPLVPFELINGDGKTITQNDFKGRWSFLFFGYTHCPDVCPISLQVLNETLQQLQPEVDAGAVRGVFVSVDPERDTPEKLKTYVNYFHPAIVGATGTDEQLKTLTRSLGIIYAKVENEEHPERYLVDHSAAILVINPKAEFAAVMTPPHDSSIMAADFRTLKSLGH